MKPFFLLSLILATLSIYAEPVCQKCEVIREYNKTHPGDYEYYEDYLKTIKQKKVGEQEQNNGKACLLL